MIEIKNVSKVYGKNFKAVDNLSLEIKDGEIFGLLGPNGAGKTTTLKMLTGISPVTSGEITLNGHNTTRNALEAKLQFGFIPDNPDIFIRLKGLEYLQFIATLYNVPKNIAQERIVTLAKRFEIADDLNDRIQSYSHGMRQKLLMIGVLLHQPPIWILDEPLTGLDPRSSFILKEMMKEHAQNGKTVLFSTHILDVAEKLCDRIGIISQGKLLFVGTMKELQEFSKADQSLESIFLELTNNE